MQLLLLVYEEEKNLKCRLMLLLFLKNKEKVHLEKEKKCVCEACETMLAFIHPFGYHVALQGPVICILRVPCKQVPLRIVNGRARNL